MPPPPRVNLETTLACDLACPMCGTARRPRPSGGMDPTLLHRIQAQLLPGAALVGLTVAGEPLLTPNLESLVQRLTAGGARLEVTTNGQRAVPPWILDRSATVRFSLDGATQSTLTAIRPGASLARLTAHIRRAVAMASPRTRIALAMVLQRRNVQELPALVELAADLGVHRLEVSTLAALWPDQEGESLRHSPSLADAFTLEARKKADQLGLCLILPPRMDGGAWPASPLSRLGRWRDARGADPRVLLPLARHRASLALWSRRAGGRVPCPSLQGMAWVSLGGDVSPCCMPGRPVAGNLHRQSFAQIWNGPVLTRMRRALLIPNAEEGLGDRSPFPCCVHCTVHPQP